MKCLIGFSIFLLLGGLFGSYQAVAQSATTLIDQLKDSSPAARRAAAYRLGRSCVRPSSRTVQSLVKALDDSAWEVRAAAAQSLGSFGQMGTKAVPDLLAHSKDEQADVREAVALSLGRLNVRSDEVFESLAVLSRDNDPKVKRNAAVALALLGKMDDSTMTNVVEALRHGSSGAVEAAQALCIRVGVESPEKVVPALVEALQENPEPLGSRVLWVMNILGKQAEVGLPGIVAAYGKLGKKDRLSAVAVVAKADKDGEFLSRLLSAAFERPNAEERRQSLLLAMRYRPGWNKLLPPTIQAMKDPDPVNRYSALRSAGQFKAKADVLLPEIILLTKDKDRRVRKAAVDLLGLIGKPRADVLDALEKPAAGDDLVLKSAAMKALSNIGHSDPGAVISVLERVGRADAGEPTKKMIDAIVKKLEKRSRHKPSPKEPSGEGR